MISFSRRILIQSLFPQAFFTAALQNTRNTGRLLDSQGAILLGLSQLHKDRAIVIQEISRVITFLISTVLSNASSGALLMPQLRDGFWNLRPAQHSCHCNSNNPSTILEKKKSKALQHLHRVSAKALLREIISLEHYLLTKQHPKKLELNARDFGKQKEENPQFQGPYSWQLP